jgi:hypothetical protein
MSRFMPLPGADSLQNTTLSSPNTLREAMDTVSPRAIAAKVKNLRQRERERDNIYIYIYIYISDDICKKLTYMHMCPKRERER